MNSPIKILIAEHDAHDLEMIVYELKNSAISFVVECIHDEAAYRKALTVFIPDVILCDYNFPSFDGLTAFKIREAHMPQTPFILVSGTIGDEDSIDLIKNGVTDFVLKDKLFTLNTKLARALKEADESRQKIKIEEDLKQSEARLVKAQAIAKMGSWETNLSDFEVIWSVETCRIFEINADTFRVSHSNFMEFVHPDDRAKVERALRKSFGEKGTHSVEHRIITGAGAEKMVEERWEILCDHQGNPVRAVGTCQDITERKTAEKALQAERHQYLDLFKLAPSCFGVLRGPEHIFERANPLYLQLSGRVDVIGKSVREVFPEVEGQGFFEQLDAVYRTGVPFSGTETLLQLEVGNSKLEDIYMDFIYQPFRNANNVIEGIFFFGNNVTEQVLARRKIEESGRRYRQIVETAQEGIWLIDEDHRTTFVNSKMCEILEYTESEMIGKDIFFFMDEPGKLLAAELMDQKKQGHAGQGHFKYIAKTGREVWTNLSANPLFHDDGEYAGSLAMVTDITESRNAMEKIDKLNRLYNFISQVNKHIVRIKDEDELFRNACNIAYTFGKFKMAWIGIFEPGTDNITMREQKGIPANEVPDLLHVPHLYEEACGFVKKTGTYFLCNNIPANPALQHCKFFAGEYGINSAIVLPIKREGKTIGSFNLYSQEIDFFDKEEITLLVEVCGDISYAIDILENKKRYKETEKLLFDNEKRFRALIEKSADMKTLATSGGEILYGSNSIKKYLGYSVLELIGKAGTEFIHPDDVIDMNEMQNLVATPGKSINLQHRVLHKNGSWVWCEGTISNLLHEPGVHALVCNFRDISEKKKVELQRDFDSINLKALINNTTDLMWSVDTDFKLITFNQPFFDIIERTSGKCLVEGDDVFLSVLSTEQQDQFERSYRRAFTGEAFIKIEHISTLFTEFWSEISFYPIRMGTDVIGTACHSRDITERIKAEKRDKFQATLLNTIGQATIATNMQGEINFWNKAASAIYGWTEEEVMGRNILEITPSQQTKEQAEQLMQQLLRGSTWSGEFMVKRKDNTEFPAFVTNAPIHDKQQQLIGIIGVSSDITNRKQAELRLKESNEQYKLQAKALALSNMELEQFAYVASHDLQEPLRMVTSFLSRLEKKYGEVIDDKGRQYIEFAVDGAKRMRQIILDLLEFSRVGKTEDHGEYIDLNEIVDEIKILFRKKIDEKKAEINVISLPHVTGFRSPTRQVFQNLLNNALTYTVKDRAVKISIRCTALADHWQFAISDNGLGIDPEYFDKIFVIFQRLHTKEEFHGTGMGLAITRKIIENQGGRIWVESNPGKGSTFYFTLLKD